MKCNGGLTPALSRSARPAVPFGRGEGDIYLVLK
jgi:hypothetical protein